MCLRLHSTGLQTLWCHLTVTTTRAWGSAVRQHSAPGEGGTPGPGLGPRERSCDAWSCSQVCRGDKRRYTGDCLPDSPAWEGQKDPRSGLCSVLQAMQDGLPQP